MKTSIVLGLEVPSGPNGVSIVTLLQAIQEKYNYLPEELLKKAAEEMDVPLIDVYSVAKFYKSFSLVPEGRHQIVTCSGTACHVRGSEKITEEISRILGVEVGSTSPDGEYSLKCVNCVGACASAPLVLVDGHYYGNMTPLKVNKLFDHGAKGKTIVS
ncbi:MAG: NAD(P)H-dependent oxidoreductase subunit E [Bacillota bacterium]